MLESNGLNGLNFYPDLTPNIHTADDHFCRYNFVSEYIKGKSVLDAACGEGYGAEILIDNGAIKYTGIDINNNNIDHANTKYQKLKGATFHNADALTFETNETFQIICSFETIEHVIDPQKLLVNMYQYLASDGILFISTPYRYTYLGNSSIYDKPKNIHHIREFMPLELISLLKNAGFNPVSMYGQRLAIRNHKNIVSKLLRKIIGETDRNSSPYLRLFNNYSFKPSPITKIPKYFLILATK